jgi:pilus assembly protein CpaB
MSLRGILMLALAALIGGAAVFMARGWIEAQVPKTIVVAEAKTEPTIPLDTIVVARRDLFFGDKLVGDFVQEVQWPADTVPAGSFKSAEELLKQSRSVVRPIARNEPILASKLSGEGGRATLSAVVTDAMRAVTIRVNDVLGVAGFVLPGDRVDILLTRGGEGSLITDILLQNMKVLGIDQNANDNADDPKVSRTVTLEATPYQSQKLVLASQVGTLSLALRNYVDVDETPQRTVTVKDLTIGEINVSPNAQVAAREGAGRGPSVPQSPESIMPAAGEPPPPAPETVAQVVTRSTIDPLANVTVVRGTHTASYKVHPSR